MNLWTLIALTYIFTLFTLLARVLSLGFYVVDEYTNIAMLIVMASILNYGITVLYAVGYVFVGNENSDASNFLSEKAIIKAEKFSRIIAVIVATIGFFNYLETTAEVPLESESQEDGTVVLCLLDSLKCVRTSDGAEFVVTYKADQLEVGSEVKINNYRLIRGEELVAGRAYIVERV